MRPKSPNGPNVSPTLTHLTAQTDMPPTTPPDLTNWTGWEKWEELVLVYLSQFRNPTIGVPLSYVIREHGEVPAELLFVDYATIDDDLIMTTRLTGDQYEQDAQRIWDLLVPLWKRDLLGCQVHWTWSLYLPE
jgi:hypothetical protein